MKTSSHLVMKTILSSKILENKVTKRQRMLWKRPETPSKITTYKFILYTTKNREVLYLYFSTLRLEYVKIGRNTMMDFLKLNNDDNWKFEKSYAGCNIFKKSEGSELPCFKITAKFDFPTLIVFDHVRIPENRIQWDTNYESINIVKEYPLHT